MSAEDYTTLHLPLHPPPSLKTIVTTYRTLALTLHPDKNPLDTASATAQFQALQTAYKAILSTFAAAAVVDGDDGEKVEGIKQAKPWNWKRGRKFNYRDVKQVQELKRERDRHAAERELKRVLGEEGGERPGEKRCVFFFFI